MCTLTHVLGLHAMHVQLCSIHCVMCAGSDWQYDYMYDYDEDDEEFFTRDLEKVCCLWSHRWRFNPFGAIVIK